MKNEIRFKLIQLERLGKKQKKFTVRKIEKVGKIEVSSLVFGPSSENNCKNFLNRLKG